MIDLMERQLKLINEQILSQEDLLSNMDELRGKLIGVESKVNKLIETGRSVDQYRIKIDTIRELIDTEDVKKAQDEMRELEESINDEIYSTTKKTISQPPIKSTPEPETESRSELTAEESKRKLNDLVSEISREMKIRKTKGEETSAIKNDIEIIKNLVLSKDYVKAYKVAKECLERISNK